MILLSTVKFLKSVAGFVYTKGWFAEKQMDVAAKLQCIDDFYKCVSEMC